MKIVSIPTVVLFAILMVACGGEEDGEKDSNGDVTIPSIFTNFDVGSWVNAIGIDAADGKWIGTDEGVSYLDDNGTPTNKADDSWTTFTTADGLAYDFVLAIGFDVLGRKWFATYGGGVSYLDDNDTPANKADDTWTTFTTADGLINNYVRVIAFDASGGKWFGATGDGVSYFDDNGTPTNKADDTWTSFTIWDGLADQYVDAIAIDSAGGKWFGTLEGVNYLDDNGTPSNKSDDAWVTFTESDGLVYDGTRDIVIDSSGGKWFAHGLGIGGGVDYLDDNGTPANKTDDTWITFTTADGLYHNIVAEIAIDPVGDKWFMHHSSTSYLKDNGTPTDKTDDTWTTYSYADGFLCGNNGRAVAIDASGGKWFGGSGGVTYCP